jgi:hypothetical protein
MPKKRYVVDLTPEERNALLAMVKSGPASARKLTRASKSTRTWISFHATLECLVRSMPDHLREDRTSLIHPNLSCCAGRQQDGAAQLSIQIVPSLPYA